MGGSIDVLLLKLNSIQVKAIVYGKQAVGKECFTEKQQSTGSLWAE